MGAKAKAKRPQQSGKQPGKQTKKPLGKLAGKPTGKPTGKPSGKPYKHFKKGHAGPPQAPKEAEQLKEPTKSLSTKKSITPKKSISPEKTADNEPELTDTLFLRNVSRFDTTQESLKAHMEENFGETVYCLICKDKETGESKGTAFVKFKEAQTASKCLEEFKDRDLQTKFFLDGRNLFVLPALTRNQADEVRQASAKSDKIVIKKKQFKKARHHRVPTKPKT